MLTRCIEQRSTTRFSDSDSDSDSNSNRTLGMYIQDSLTINRSAHGDIGGSAGPAMLFLRRCAQSWAGEQLSSVDATAFTNRKVGRPRKSVSKLLRKWRRKQ